MLPLGYRAIIICNVYKLVNLNRKININGILREDEPLNIHNTFQTGGKADIYAEPANRKELLLLLKVLREENIPWFILGGGANILISDRGVRGAVINMGRLNRIALDHTPCSGDTLIMEAGLGISRGAEKAARWGLKGMEFIYAMPGSVGGALWMNARCYGGEISHIFSWADIVNENLDMERIFFKEDDWMYKKSPFQNRDCVILSAAFRVNKGNRKELQKKMAFIREDRASKGHFRAPCAGSTFKNNRDFGVPSGILIEKAGLKGTRLGGAAVSDWHGNILINEKDASSAEIAELIELVQKTVQKETGFLLEPEVLKIGEWD